ncbi:MAG: hypothetical protein ACI4UL_02535, partial [Muribaculaceae bacterium]
QALIDAEKRGDIKNGKITLNFFCFVEKSIPASEKEVKNKASNRIIATFALDSIIIGKRNTIVIYLNHCRVRNKGYKLN